MPPRGGCSQSAPGRRGAPRECIAAVGRPGGPIIAGPGSFFSRHPRMSVAPVQVQFDPASARFGASRSQKRLEDERLLAGRGVFSDDRLFPKQAWLVLVRSPYAHARIASVDLSAATTSQGVLAAWSMAELRADGIGHIPFPPLFKRADGAPMAAPPRTLLAEAKVYYAGQPVIAVIAE